MASLKLASPIHLLERDNFLRLAEKNWPPRNLPLFEPRAHDHELIKEDDNEPDRWVAEPWGLSRLEDKAYGYLQRALSNEKEPSPMPRLYEAVVRFPTAPLFGLQRKCDYQFRMTPVHQHTFRILKSRPFSPTKNPQVDRLYIFFNGLNETDNFRLYYNLARVLIDDDESGTVACIIHPSPGHLTRYPLVGKYAEKPLQRFISDPCDLFRQYLRAMIELQWLLSALVPIGYYPAAPGVTLLDANHDVKKGRCDTDHLSQTITAAWSDIYKGSLAAIRRGSEAPELKKRRKQGASVSEEMVRRSIEVIRHLIGWKPHDKKLTDIGESEPLPAPNIHLVGYSLGGYLGQSVFFSWPYAVNSCTTLCSGGSFQELQPEKIVHPEEWRALSHQLKYEIESAMLEGRLRIQGKGLSASVFGIPLTHFRSHFQIFNDVFLQDPNGSYKPRVSEFASRLLFVVGGNDPIVSTKSVLEASPKGGVNMVQVAKLSHFLATQKGEWPRFWLPSIGRLISSLAGRSETLLADSLLSNLWDDDTTGPAKNKFQAVSDQRNRDNQDPETKGSDQLQARLQELVKELTDGGFLLVLRNQIPVTLMGSRLLHRRGSVPHYEDFRIRLFWVHAQETYRSLLDHQNRLTIVVPARLRQWFRRPPAALTSKSCLMTHDADDAANLEIIWEKFLGDWESEGALHCFDAEMAPEERFKLEQTIRRGTATPQNSPILNCLPDLWISFSKALASHLAGEAVTRLAVHEAFLRHSAALYEQRNGLSNIKNASPSTKEWLASGQLRIVRISEAQSPRFLGEQIMDSRIAEEALIHAALALDRAAQCVCSGDFEKFSLLHKA